MSAADRLRQHAAQATEIGNEDSFEAKQRIDASHQALYRLQDLAPELAALAADMADALAEYDAQCECGTCLKARALLARLDKLTQSTP